MQDRRQAATFDEETTHQRQGNSVSYRCRVDLKDANWGYGACKHYAYVVIEGEWVNVEVYGAHCSGTDGAIDSAATTVT